MNKSYGLFLVLLIVIAGAGCSTPQQAAQRKLNKALKLDPSVLSNLDKDTLITGIAEGQDTLYLPGDTSFILVDCDSLNKALQDPKNSKGIVLLDNKNNSLTVGKSAKTKGFKLTLTNKPKTIIRTIRIRYFKTVTIRHKAVRVEVKAPIYKYWEWWLMVVIIGLMLFNPLINIFTTVKKRLGWF